ncbi:hypothetical protein N0V84_000370 [Fusarium piperis]|uniref:Protein kinase domain-containing protein n=1 Tax=Fusarium piperis TaxID=1435070 RepID=A0A9W8WN26_9HYPO|nr:hypothetical protein N0V84_000370 [Fusarium piperis]
MSGVELGLASFAAADLVLKYGRRLIKLYKDYNSADDYVKESILLVETILSRADTQVEFLRQVESKLSNDQRRIQFELYEMLKDRLHITVGKLESVISEKGLKKVKLAFVKSSIKEVMEQLERWQKIFDPTWLLIFRTRDIIMDTELKTELEASSHTGPAEESIAVQASRETLAEAHTFRSIFNGEVDQVHVSLSQERLNWRQAVPVSFSSTQIIERIGSQKRYLVNSIPCHSNMDIIGIRADSEDLARKLHQINTEDCGLLACHGLVKRRDPGQRKINSLDLVFQMPPNEVTPVTLRERLMQRRVFSLTQALNLSRHLARAVSYVHAYNFVHKNIRPENILLFPKNESSTSLGSAYLLGFDSFRSVNFQTLFQGDITWDGNLYRHPGRQGLRAHDKYVMQHDVYSLGVCLLEIGLWASFVQHDGEMTPGEALGLTVEDFSKIQETGKPSSLIKDHLVELAQCRLPMKMGDRYTAVVVTCLCCLDDDNEDFGEESDMRDDDGILIGVKFIGKVLMRLNEISV